MVALAMSGVTLAAGAADASRLIPFSSEDSRVKISAPDSFAVTLHVSPAGSDSNAGTAEKPFATLEAARNALRSLRKAASYTQGAALVLVHGSIYPVRHTFDLTVLDSGTEVAPTIYRAAPGETPRFSGGLRVEGFGPVRDADALRRLPADVASQVVEVDLRDRGVTNLLPLLLGGFASGNGFKTHPANELFFNGQAMQMARGPNAGFLHIADVVVKDGTKGYDREGSKVGRFFYTNSLPSRWASEPDLLLYGYWFWDWADSYERVASIDTTNRVISLAEPWHTYGYSIGAPFYAVNALCELDLPGEYYLDRKNLRLFFYPPSDPKRADVELSILREPMVNLDGASNIRFEGFTWEYGCADAIHINSGSNCLFAGCKIRNFAGTGIEMNGGTHHGLLSCDIFSMGRGGVILRGGDRKTLTPGNHFVENCDIHDLSRIDHTYTPAVAVGGVGNRLAHNRFHDIASSAMSIGGNEHLIEFNEIYNVVLESDDQGGADMYGDPTFRGNVYRFNYWHHIGNWRGTGKDAKCGQAGVRLDDAISGTLIYGNIFERCSTGKDGFGGVQIHGGKDNVVATNLFLDCAAAMSFSPWDGKRWSNYVAHALESKAIDATLYEQRYPQLAHLAQNPNVNIIEGNWAFRCGELFRHAPPNLIRTNNVLNPEGAVPTIPAERFGLYKDAYRTSVAVEGRH